MSEEGWSYQVLWWVQALNRPPQVAEQEKRPAATSPIRLPVYRNS